MNASRSRRSSWGFATGNALVVHLACISSCRRASSSAERRQFSRDERVKSGTTRERNSASRQKTIARPIAPKQETRSEIEMSEYRQSSRLGPPLQNALLGGAVRVAA